MNSNCFEMSHGFLKSKSVFHSAERWRRKRGVTPISSSSQFSIGVTSTATLGPKLDPPPERLVLEAPPSSRIATALSAVCAAAAREQRSNAAAQSSHRKVFI